MKTLTFLKNKPLPKFILKNKAIKQYKEIEKIFPAIGLNNCSLPLERIKYSQKDVAQELIRDLHSLLKNLYYGRYYSHYTVFRSNFENITNNLSNLTYQDLIQNKRINKLPEKYHFHYRGTNVKTLNEVLMFINGIKNKHYIPLPTGKNLKVVFSSEKTAGLWDITTMSMRGISSCQSWGGSYKHNLIGSLLDPFVGIIYITDESDTKYGSKMLRRAVVRYVIEHKTKKPHLYIERVYPSSYDNKETLHLETLYVFKAFLEQKTNNKIPVVFNKASKYYIPNSKYVKFLSKLERTETDYYYNGGGYLSYRDSGICYGKELKTYLYKLNIKSSTKFVNK